ncbi:uncharacterized protein LOC106081010 isoform X1 [Stomoxys calcitrans]|uniref:Galectin n=1 Tax=Stomoxys calcitrans TaxID=35570 RepID=A0A1I8PG20_STOCA|nr:uncharacterized protein LOC106081010 isoform X1 [Stomoxys calcitrans]XP_059220019.1 uncharacterized protein LOC106081010 isoform X1 [Stomoxys calcitrans]XP_059220020.1 uncharacterized protein LOC106081010 isoform X1 [Stomoxys calcitrans]
MPSIAYAANIIPNILREGDKIRIKGVIKDNAKEFSINFVNEICNNPEFITYHFKWILDEQVIVENYKDNGSWMDHMEQDYDDLDGVFIRDAANDFSVASYNNNNTILNYSVLGSVFELEFAFQDGVIDVYKIYENAPNRITTYETYFDISEIKALHVWGDVKKISELTFKYA